MNVALGIAAVAALVLKVQLMRFVESAPGTGQLERVLLVVLVASGCLLGLLLLQSKRVCLPV